uniref:Uncharacterized protein n=1 Tax=Rhizophora mucronata TaxID=61149 RepID=A0A2P2P968_RHIMU
MRVFGWGIGSMNLSHSREMITKLGSLTMLQHQNLHTHKMVLYHVRTWKELDPSIPLAC